ncbi:hypothetical protein PIB30_047889, partial [Stylosanthes scabra]|nr:hypothetical protein [Stylosanthes scabra]
SSTRLPSKIRKSRLARFTPRPNVSLEKFSKLPKRDPSMIQGSSPSLHQSKIMLRLVFTTHLAKRDIHELKASLGKLAKLKNKSRLAHVP